MYKDSQRSDNTGGCRETLEDRFMVHHEWFCNSP